MPRPLALGLLAALLAAAPRAQTAADSALVRDVVGALRLDHQMALAGALLGAVAAQAPWVAVEPLAPSPATLRKVEAAVTAALLADLQPDHLRATLAYLQSGVADRSLALVQRLATAEGLSAVAEAALAADDDALADEATARRFRRASNPFHADRHAQEVLVDHLARSKPLRDRLTRRGLSPTEFFEALRASMASDGPSDMELLGVRYMLAQMPPDDVQAALQFGESDAGRYLQQTLAEPVTRALAVWMAAWMESFFVALFDSPPPPPPAEMAPPSPVRDPLPPETDAPESDAPSPDAPDETVLEVVDTPPVLVGGLDGLAARLTYPEAARRANVEGTVYVTFVVDRDGRPRHLQASGVGDERLRGAALDVVQASQFEPGRQRGKPVRVRFTLPVRFQLR